MRCRECATEVAVTARVCPRCGAPIVGQPTVVADTVVSDTVVADTVVDAVSDAAWPVFPAVAGPALPEPYVPGSGDSPPAKLRLVLAGYIAIACGLFPAALAWAVAAADFLFFFFFTEFDADPDSFYGFFIALVWGSILVLAVVLFVLVLRRALKALQAGIRFSRLLRRPSDPRTATVMASKRGGRTLVLDINPGGYQPLFEVRLALWTKAEMLMPGESVTVYGRPGSQNPLLVSSAQRGRAFLGTVTSRSTLRPGPLDEKVIGATLVDWAAWAALTTFSSTGLRLGEDKREVDAFRGAVRDTSRGVNEPPVRANDVRRTQFSTHRRGYDKKEVAAFLEAAGLRLAAMESTDRPVAPLVSSAILAGWAEWADSTTFSDNGWRDGYDAAQVDAFLRAIRDTFRGVNETPVRSDEVRVKKFSLVEPGDLDTDAYDQKQVDAFLDAAGIRLAALESTDRPQGPLVSEVPESQPQWESPEDPHSLPSWPSPISESESKSEGEAEADGAGDPAPSHPGLVLPIVVFLGGLVVTVATLLAISLPATRAERAIEQGPRVTATVSDVQQPAFYEDLLLTYSYDGQEYSIWRGRNDTSPPLEVGMSVQVSLDPADPAWAASETLDPTSAFVETFIIVGSVLGPVSTVWAGILCILRLSERFRARRTNGLVRARAHS
jgi:DivIVA domain-containing protein